MAVTEWFMLKRLVVLGVLFGGSVFCAGAPVLHAQTGAVAAVVAKGEEKKIDGQSLVQVDVSATGVKDLGGLQFILEFDGALLEVDHVAKSDFLGSSGRQVLCNEPTIETNTIRYECVTLGAEPRAGVDGDGLLASVFFKPKGDEDSEIKLQRVQLTTPPGEQIDASFEAGAIDIKRDSGGMMWGVLAVVGIIVLVILLAGVFVIRRRSRSRAASAESQTWSRPID
jgi:hypothetical protein